MSPPFADQCKMSCKQQAEPSWLARRTCDGNVRARVRMLIAGIYALLYRSIVRLEAAHTRVHRGGAIEEGRGQAIEAQIGRSKEDAARWDHRLLIIHIREVVNGVRHPSGVGGRY